MTDVIRIEAGLVAAKGSAVNARKGLTLVKAACQ
jgi:hypothetical protein